MAVPSAKNSNRVFGQVKANDLDMNDLDIEIKDWSHSSAKSRRYGRVRGTVKTSVVPKREIRIADQTLSLTPS